MGLHVSWCMLKSYLLAVNAVVEQDKERGDKSKCILISLQDQVWRMNNVFVILGLLREMEYNRWVIFKPCAILRQRQRVPGSG